MIANLIVLGGVLLVAYLWSSQGLFSALLHLACTIAAGAIAFALWEPLTYGFLLNMQEDMAWGLGLVVPFFVSLFVLRIAMDRLIPANLRFDPATNLVGGGALGAVSGVITMGVILVGVGSMRMPIKLLGYNPVGYDSTGNVARSAGSRLWLPADALTVGLYEKLSGGAFSTATPLAQYQPDAHLQAGLLRYTFGDGTRRLSRVTLKPDDFSIVGSYTVEADNPRALFSDSFSLSPDGDPVPQRVAFIDGASPPSGTRLVGYVIRFGPGAREKRGQVVVGPAQMRLLSVDQSGKTIETFPVAVVAQADGQSAQASRFRFDAPEVFIASVGGATEAEMAFEFPVPPGATPRFLEVKNIRVSLASVAPLPIAQQAAITPRARDEAIRGGAVLGGGVDLASLDKSSASEMRTVGNDFRPDQAGILLSPSLGSHQFRTQIASGFDLDAEHRIRDGRKTFTESQFENRGVPDNLLVREFAVDPGVRIVQIDVSMDRKHSILGRTFEMAENVLPPALIDTQGRRYDAVGWIFEDSPRIDIRFTPGQPVRALAEIPQLSRSKPNQQLRLIFRVTEGAEVSAFTLGSRVIVEYNPPLRIGR